MLRTSELDEPTRARAIETIDRNAKLQNQLIEDILDVSRIVAGKFHVEMRSVDLVKVLEAARDTVAPMAASRKVDLHARRSRRPPRSPSATPTGCSRWRGTCCRTRSSSRPRGAR